MSRTLHVVALPHTTLTDRDSSCAYSQKVRRFVPMMRAQGCRVVLYGPDEIDCEPDEHVVITRAHDRRRWGFESFDTVRTELLWDAGQPYFAEANARAIDALRERVEPRDYLCLTTSWPQKPIADAVAPGGRSPIVVEWTVGYEGVAFHFAAFESYAWMHHVYGIRAAADGWERVGRAYDRVIPNFFNPADFHDPARWQGAPRAEYLLYVGRLVSRKGPHIAGKIAQRLGVPLLVAGPGATAWTNGRRIEAEGLLIEGDVHYMGEVRPAERANLMARAQALLVPTEYVEPFGGVAVEAMLSGCPVVASDWGAFTETVTPEVGARFRTLAQGCEAVERVRDLDPVAIRRHAVERYSLDAVGAEFTAWFDQLDTLWGEGWAA